jgi:hypothetical protein
VASRGLLLRNVYFLFTSQQPQPYILLSGGASLAVLFSKVGDRGNIESDSSETSKRCPCLAGESSLECQARWGGIRPNSVEISLYCFRTDFPICPVFSRFNKTGRRLTRWEYVVENLKHEKKALNSVNPKLVTFEP